MAMATTTMMTTPTKVVLVFAGNDDGIIGEERIIEKLLKAPLEKWWVCFTLILF